MHANLKRFIHDVTGSMARVCFDFDSDNFYEKLNVEDVFDSVCVHGECRDK